MKSRLGMLVRTMYDQQKLRISIGNRLVQIFRNALGLTEEQYAALNKDEQEEKSKKLLKILKEEYDHIKTKVKIENRLMSDEVLDMAKRRVRLPKNYKEDKEITLLKTQDDIRIFEAFDHMRASEDIYAELVAKELVNYPFYNYYLVNVHGVGPRMAGVILSEIDITKCNSIAALHKYCGVDVVVYEDDDGVIHSEGRSRRKAHLVDKEYIDMEGELVKTKGITFNPFVKTKLLGVLGPSFIKMGGPYRTVYDNYKQRLDMHPNWEGKSKGHKHNAAVRYMIKEFLADMWTYWRQFENLPLKGRYEQVKLGYTHPQRTLREIFEKPPKREKKAA